MALTPKDAVLFDLYTSLAERLSAGARSVSELVTTSPELRREIAKRVGQIETEADELFETELLCVSLAEAELLVEDCAL